MHRNLKVVLIGDETVGKTSLVHQFVDERFQDAYKKTLGFEVSVKSIQLDDGSPLILSIWDIGGNDLLQHHDFYYQNARGIFLVFDQTNPESFQHLPEWVDYVRAVLPDPKIPLLLVGNKEDLCATEDRILSSEQINEMRKQIQAAEYLATSAKTGKNVDLMFQTMGMALSL